MIWVKQPSKEDIDTITFDEEIYDRAADDLCPPIEEVKKMGIINHQFFDFFGCYLGNKIIGLVSIEKGGKFHFEVLKPYRQYARECLKSCLQLIQDDIYCEIPTLYQSVINFAKKGGFKEVGVVDNNYIKNNIKYNSIKLEYVKD